MKEVLILDGGLGTSLEQKHGVEFSKATPLWSSDLLVSSPNTLLACQQEFGNVPVDIILTATYQASIRGFHHTKNDKFPRGIATAEIPSFLNAAVDIAAGAKQPHAAVALSIGPYGACMTPSQEYSGSYDAEHSSGTSLLAWHRERLELFASVPDVESRVSYTALETVPRIDEIIAMRTALASCERLSTLPFWISCLFPGDDNCLPDGHSAEEAVRAMLDPSATGRAPWGIGINCTKVWKLPSLVRTYEATVRAMMDEGSADRWPALVLYPDGTNGEVYNTETQKWELPDGVRTTNQRAWERQLADVVSETRERGCWKQIVVGGCCMASAEHIKSLRDLVLEPSENTEP